MSSLQYEPLKTLCEKLKSAHDAIADLCSPGKSLRVNPMYVVAYTKALRSFNVARFEIYEYVEFQQKCEAEAELKQRCLDKYASISDTVTEAASYIAKMAVKLGDYPQNIRPDPELETRQDTKTLCASFKKTALEHSDSLANIHQALQRIFAENNVQVSAMKQARKRQQEARQEQRFSL